MSKTIFEKIIAREIPAQIVYEDDLVLAFRDITPQAPTHVLIIPKQPIPRIAEAGPADHQLLGHLLLKAAAVADKVGLKSGGYRLVINNGPDGGESVPHLHCHILAAANCNGRPVELYSCVKLISWNVNGLRAVLKKNFLEFLERRAAGHPVPARNQVFARSSRTTLARALHDLLEQRREEGLLRHGDLHPARPLQVTPHLSIAEHDKEGRVLTAEYDDFFLVNVYTPNSKRELTRLAYRQQWDQDFLKFLKKLEKKKPVIWCGDLNVAHTEIDLANPKANVKNHGFTPEERAGFDAFVARRFCGYLPRIRERAEALHLVESDGHGPRQRNIGWRLDYFLISQALRPQLKKAPRFSRTSWAAIIVP
jgi:exodeoxyribonuclease-3